MTNVLITIETPSGSLDLSVPGRVPITDLLEMLAPVVGEHAPGWTLTHLHGSRIEGTETLEQAGVLDGARLIVAPGDAEPPSVVATARKPGLATANPRVIPDRASTRERLTVAMRALIGSHRPAGAVGPVDRVARAWEWTNHRRRLEWLLSRPRVDQPVTIGVSGHRADEVAEGLADALTANRLERVVLIDAGRSGTLSRRLPHPGSGYLAIESVLREGDLSNIERDLPFGRTRQGSLVVPSPLDGQGPSTSIVHLLRGSPATRGALVVIDCGTSDAPNEPMLEVCDQLILSTTGRTPRLPAPTITTVWGEDQVPSNGETAAVCRISEDPETMLELAVVAAGAWTDLGIASVLPLTST